MDQLKWEREVAASEAEDSDGSGPHNGSPFAKAGALPGGFGKKQGVDWRLYCHSGSDQAHSQQPVIRASFFSLAQQE